MSLDEYCNRELVNVKRCLLRTLREAIQDTDCEGLEERLDRQMLKVKALAHHVRHTIADEVSAIN